MQSTLGKHIDQFEFDLIAGRPEIRRVGRKAASQKLRKLDSGNQDLNVIQVLSVSRFWSWVSLWVSGSGF